MPSGNGRETKIIPRLNVELGRFYGVNAREREEEDRYQRKRE